MTVALNTEPLAVANGCLHSKLEPLFCVLNPRKRKHCFSCSGVLASIGYRQRLRIECNVATCFSVFTQPLPLAVLQLSVYAKARSLVATGAKLNLANVVAILKNER